VHGAIDKKTSAAVRRDERDVLPIAPSRMAWANELKLGHASLP